MKVADLSGELLDYWVAKGEGKLTFDSTEPANATVVLYGIGGEIEGHSPLSIWSPSSDWEDGGEIINRWRIGLQYGRIDREWKASFTLTNGDVICQSGDTALVAAMRAYVAGTFGDDVPENSA